MIVGDLFSFSRRVSSLTFVSTAIQYHSLSVITARGSDGSIVFGIVVKFFLCQHAYSWVMNRCT